MNEMLKRVQQAINSSDPTEATAAAEAAIKAVRDEIRDLVNNQGYSQFEILKELDSAIK